MAKKKRLSSYDRGLLFTFFVGLFTGVIVSDWVGAWRGAVVGIVVLVLGYFALKLTSSARGTARPVARRSSSPTYG